LLASTRDLDFGNISAELIVVDNGSSDNSIQIAMSFGAKVIVEEHANISGLRNLGAKHGKGDYYAFVDADCVVAPSWLADALEHFRDGGVGIVGRIPDCRHDATWAERAWVSIRPQLKREVTFLSSMNMIIKKEAFEQIGGFDEDLSTGEDYDLCRRARRQEWKIVSSEKANVVHLGYPRTIWERFKKEIWYGESMFRILTFDPLYKPFWATLLYGVGLIFIVYSVILSKFRGHFLVGIALVLSIPAASTLLSISKSRNFLLSPQLYVLYHAYFAGRFTSLLKCILNKFRIKGKKRDKPRN